MVGYLNLKNIKNLMRLIRPNNTIMYHLKRMIRSNIPIMYNPNPKAYTPSVARSYTRAKRGWEKIDFICLLPQILAISIWIYLRKLKKR